jgi:peptidoglycan/xylan/chitin deacetylase (PgdA/CDA1 family)
MIKNYLRKIYTNSAISPLINLFGSPWKGKGAILVYHRVVKDEEIEEDLELGLTVSCSNFEKHIKEIKSKYKICSMDEFVRNLKKKNNEFMVAITFDDGYKDNLYQALPILTKHEVPASIYVTTRFLNQEVDIWWYELGEVIQNRTEINFQYKEKKFNFLLDNKKRKFLAYQNLMKLFKSLKIDAQNELMEKITNTKKRKNYSHICLNSEEILMLEKNPLITINSHGHNHQNLKILSDDEVKYEITKSLEVLENLINRKVKHFAYPFGGKDQVSTREYNVIEDMNFDSAVIGSVYPIKDCNFFSLPRIYVGKNTCEKTLINHLSGFYNLASKLIN